MNRELADTFRLGDFDVDSRSNEIAGPNGVVTLEPLVMNVLVCLTQHAGEVVPRDVIIAEVWRRATGDQVLDRCISELRTALRDDARRPQYIKTYPKSGYKLLQSPVSTGGWRVLLIDDEELIRAAFRKLLETYDGDAECFEAPNCEAAIEDYADHQQFDLIFLDLGLKGGVSGLDAIELIKKQFGTRIVIVSGQSDSKTIESALALDTEIVAGYMPKLMKYQAFRPALDLIRGGSRYVPPELFG
jgi:DNA-binding response OmpR family regulator